MPKSKPPRDIRDRRKRPPRPRGTQKTGLTKRICKLFVALGTIASILALAAFLPHLTVASAESLRPDDPMGTIFTLSNDGILWINDVTVGCVMDDLETNTGGLSGMTIYPEQHHADMLNAGKRMDIPCRSAMRMLSPSKAEMSLSVTYRPAFGLWHKRDSFPFRAEKAVDGKWVWAPVNREP
jgi:hypothetical protein